MGETRSYQHLYVGNRWAEPAAGKTVVVSSPHDGTPVGSAPAASAEGRAGLEAFVELKCVHGA